MQQMILSQLEPHRIDKSLEGDVGFALFLDSACKKGGDEPEG